MAKKLKLSTKLIGGFLLVALIIAIVGAVGVFGVIKTGKSFDICMDKEVPMADSSMEGTIAIISGRDLMGEFLLTEDPTELDGIEKEFSRVNQEFKEFNNYIMTKGNESLKALSVQAGQYHDDFKTNAIELIKHQREHIDYEKKSESVMKDFDTHVASLRNLLIEFEQKLTTGAEIDEQLDAAMEAKAIMFQQQALAEEYMGLESLDETEKLRKNFKALESEFDELETHLPAKVVERHAAFGKLAMSMFAMHDQTMRMNLETRSHMTLVDEFSTKTAQTFEEIEKAAADSMKKTMVTADAIESMVIWLITIVSIAGFLLGAVFGVLISRNISRPIMRIVESLGSGSDQVSSASGQVASSSQDLAEGASEQAASLEETSSSLEEMSSMTRQNAENAAQANSLMDEAKGVISRAASSMKKMTNAMSQISESGQEINKIIKTIDEIAFQTNLLALNAAVEAARAGEAGAGFAVVADEVRNLAMRAAEAAKNTTGLIEGTINQINIGTDLMQATDEAFSEVNQSASKVADLVGEIAAASTEQAQGIDQINQAISQMDKVVQNSAAGAEEGASAAEEMNAMADSMQQLVTELSAVVHGSTHDVQGQSQPHNKIAPGTFTEATEAGRIVILEDGYDAF